MCVVILLLFAISHARDRCQQRAHKPRLLLHIIGLAADRGFGAARGLHGRAGCARLGFGAGDNRATRTRARRAVANLAGLVARADAGRAGRYSRLEHVLGHVRRRRAFRLEHVPTHIGLGWARGNTRLQDVLGPVDLGALDALALVVLAAILFFTFASTVVTGLPTRAAGALGDIDEGLG